MIDPQPTILVTGATGRQGGATARHLAADGWTVRAMTRDPSQPQARLLAEMGIEVVRGDLDDADSVVRALEGIYGVFSVQSYAEHGPTGEVRQGISLADHALKAGVQHFVYTSVGGADRCKGVAHFETKWQIETHIRRIGLPATILRPVAFMESFTFPFFQTMLCSGILPSPQLEGKWQVIAVDDVGRIAASIFRDRNAFLGEEIEIAGDEMSLDEAADVFGRVIGRPVRYVQLSPDELHPSIIQQFAGFTSGGGFRADLQAIRARWPDLLTLEAWLYRTGWNRLAS